MAAVRTWVRRWIGAARLSPASFEEIEADRHASLQAGVTVLLAGLAAGVGLGWPKDGASILWFGGVALLAWASWALVTFQIGVRLLPESTTSADTGQLLRTLGFAATPAMFLVFAWWPYTRTVVLTVTSTWRLAALVVAVRPSLDSANTRRAVCVCLVGWALAIGMVVGVGFFLN